MTILIFALILLVIVGMAIYLIDLVPMDARLRIAAKVIVLVIAILLLLGRMGEV